MAIELGSDLGIEQVETLKQRLAPQLGSRRALVLDGSAVQRVHAAGLQLLLAFQRDRDREGLRTRIDAPSQPLADAARLLGLTLALGMDHPGDDR